MNGSLNHLVKHDLEVSHHVFCLIYISEALGQMYVTLVDRHFGLDFIQLFQIQCFKNIKPKRRSIRHVCLCLCKFLLLVLLKSYIISEN